MAPDARIAVAPMPADAALFTAANATRIAGRFLFVGRLNAQKGLRDLLDALAWCPAEISLDVVGSGDDADALKAHAAGLGLGSRVQWHGAVDRTALPPLYRRAQAVVMPSTQEGLGLVAVEAQLCRTPVIAYRSGGLPDVVDAQWGGVLVPPGDTRALAAAIQGVATHPELVDGYGASARAVMVDRFSPATVAAGYASLYRAVVADDA